MQLAQLYVSFLTYLTFLLHRNSKDDMSQRRNVVPWAIITLGGFRRLLANILSNFESELLSWFDYSHM